LGHLCNRKNVAAAFLVAKNRGRCDLVCQIMSSMPNKTEDSARDTTHGDSYPVDLSSIAHRHGSYDPSVKWLQMHSSWEIWSVIVDEGKSALTGKYKSYWTMAV